MASPREDKPNTAPAAGFTLIEAMVALVIVALGMMAVNMQLDRYAGGAIHIENKTLASWIASNKITELSIQATWPEFGHQDDDVDFAGRHWHRHVEVIKTPNENLRRVNVSVSLADHPDDILETVSGFIEPPVPPGIGSLHWFSPGSVTSGIRTSGIRR